MNNLQVYIEELTLKKKIYDNDLEQIINSNEAYSGFKGKMKKAIKKTMRINNEISYLHEILSNNIKEDESVRKT